MNVSLNPKFSSCRSVEKNDIYFAQSYTGRERTQKQKDAEKQVVTGGGALAATKAAKSGVDKFTKAGKVATETIKTTKETVKQAKGLWGKVVSSAKWATDSIMNWGSKFKNLKFVKPLVESKAFRYCAGGLGYAFGAVTLISGLSDIAKVTSETIESKMANN